MGKVLWVNPSFLDYRIPLYKELLTKLDGNFHLLYSKERIPARVHNRAVEELGPNAHYIENERRLSFGKSASEFANTSISIPFPKGLYKKIKIIKPDAIIAEGYFQFTPWAVVYCALHKIPLYIAYERTAHTERNCPGWRKLYRKFIGLFVKGYIANGQLTKEYLISQGAKGNRIVTGGMCADSCKLGRLTRDMSEADKDAFLRDINLDKTDGIRYIFVGQIIQRKGVIYLLNAWAEHIKSFPDDELLIVGTGEYLSEYQSMFKDYPSIKFTGGVDYSQIYKYYAISDVFVIPTLEDNWSLVVPEAMACGLPIACSIYNGCHPELVQEDEDGITFDPLESKSIINALAYFHGKDLKRMGARSIEIESGYSPSKVADNVLSIVNRF